MSDLLERLNAALNAEEELAQRVNHAGHWVLTINGDDWGIDGERRMVEHVIRQNPQAVLRKVAGARKLLAGHEGQHRCEWGEYRGGGLDPCGHVLVLAEMFGVEAPSE